MPSRKRKFLSIRSIAEMRSLRIHVSVEIFADGAESTTFFALNPIDGWLSYLLRHALNKSLMEDPEHMFARIVFPEWDPEVETPVPESKFPPL